ncbi:hypothetical protein J437_LFUL014567 [Ladona fulva]|uniref:Small ribosomal subunit protein uS15m n=1 Tax=Ladona fulva TaxID=123851 RepID=A0A8K0P3U2_LADFU|nr:hypothetical protein J437_LFUL014567 [Ladona fulva]
MLNMNPLSCIRRLKVPIASVMQYVNGNPLTNPAPISFTVYENCNINHHTRGYAFKSDLKIKWIRPTKIPCYLPEKSGDTETFPKLDLSSIPSTFQASKELQSADELVRRLFTINFLPKSWVRKEYEKMLIDRVKRHAFDTNSPEVLISRMTARIRYLQRHISEIPKDVRARVVCKEMIDRRKKHLKNLRKVDYKLFEWLLEKLNIIYRPPPKRFHWITRKESLRKLTRRYCLGIRQERILAYKKHLESQQEKFLIDKIESLNWIRKEELACGFEVTVKEEDIEEVQRKLEQLRLKKKSPQKEEVVKIPYNPEALGLDL